LYIGLFILSTMPPSSTFPGGALVASDVAFLLVPAILGLGPSAFTALTSKKTKTASIPCGRRSTLTPPPWVFVVGWTVLYVLVGIAGMLAWRRTGRRLDRRPIPTFAILVASLVFWWLTFSNICAPRLAFASILALLLVAASTAGLFAIEGERLGATLLCPLVAWLVFASYLSGVSCF
jgi:tryptophan-rich sensory protein